MRHPGAGRHPLHVARLDDRPGPEAVPVLERPGEDERQDLHVAVPVLREPLARLDPILVDHPQVGEALMVRSMVVAEREGVTTVEPSEVGMAALRGAPQRDHVSLLDIMI